MYNIAIALCPMCEVPLIHCPASGEVERCQAVSVLPKVPMALSESVMRWSTSWRHLLRNCGSRCVRVHGNEARADWPMKTEVMRPTHQFGERNTHTSLRV